MFRRAPLIIATASIGAVVALVPWLAYLSASCGDGRQGACATLGKPSSVLIFAAVLLLIACLMLYAVLWLRRPTLLELFVLGILALQVLWLVGLFPLYSGYQYPRAGGRACFDECIGSLIGFWGWMLLELVLSPFVVVAAWIAGLSVLSWRWRDRAQRRS
jgi:hypothetical protein